MADADDPGVVGAAVVQRVDPNLATAAAPPLATASLAEAAEAQAIRISCFGREGRNQGTEKSRVGLVSLHRFFQNEYLQLAVGSNLPAAAVQG